MVLLQVEHGEFYHFRGNVKIPPCGENGVLIHYPSSRHQELIGREAGHANRVEHHGGSRRGDVPARETCSGKVARLDCRMRDRSFARGLSLPGDLDGMEKDANE